MTDPLSPEAVEVQAPPTKRFRKKPIEVRAIQWTGDNRSDVEAFAGGKFEVIDPIDRHMLDDPEASASLLAAPHGSWVLVYTGDWIVRADRGGFTRCHDADFREMYDVAPEPLELTPEEQAAKERSEHMSTCHEEACVECMKELRAIRRIVKAVRPVIEADERRKLYPAVVQRLLNTAAWHAPVGLADPAEISATDLAIAETFRSEARAWQKAADDGSPVAAAPDRSSVGEGEKQ